MKRDHPFPETEAGEDSVEETAASQSQKPEPSGIKSEESGDGKQKRPTKSFLLKDMKERRRRKFERKLSLSRVERSRALQ